MATGLPPRAPTGRFLLRATSGVARGATKVLRGHTADVWGVAFSWMAVGSQVAAPTNPSSSGTLGPGRNCASAGSQRVDSWSVIQRRWPVASQLRWRRQCARFPMQGLASPSRRRPVTNGPPTASPSAAMAIVWRWRVTIAPCRSGELPTGRVLPVLTGHAADVWGGAFNPDDRTLISGDRDGTLIVWDVVTGQQVFHLHDAADPINMVAWLPDGFQVVTAGGARRVRSWDTNPDSCRNVARATANRNLTLTNGISMWASSFLMRGRVRTFRIRQTSDDRTLGGLVRPAQRKEGAKAPHDSDWMSITGDELSPRYRWRVEPDRAPHAPHALARHRLPGESSVHRLVRSNIA